MNLLTFQPDGRTLSPLPAEVVIAGLAYIPLFFLLLPSEYTRTTTDDAAFTLDDLHIYLGNCKLCLDTALYRGLQASISMPLHFANSPKQK